MAETTFSMSTACPLARMHIQWGRSLSAELETGDVKCLLGKPLAFVSSEMCGTPVSHDYKVFQAALRCDGRAPKLRKRERGECLGCAVDGTLCIVDVPIVSQSYALLSYRYGHRFFGLLSPITSNEHVHQSAKASIDPLTSFPTFYRRRPRELTPAIQPLPTTGASYNLETIFISNMPGKTLVVLGSGPGIGVSVANTFSVRGFTHVALVARNKERLDQDWDAVLTAIQERGYTCQVKRWACDIGDSEALQKVLEEIQGFGSLECVFFNAARVGGKPPLEEERGQIEIDFKVSVGGEIVELSTVSCD